MTKIKRSYPFPEHEFYKHWRKYLKQLQYKEKEIEKIMLSHDKAILLINGVILREGKKWPKL